MAEKILASAVMPSGTNYSTTSAAVKAEVLKQAGLKESDITDNGSYRYRGKERRDGQLSRRDNLRCQGRQPDYFLPPGPSSTSGDREAR